MEKQHNRGQDGAGFANIKLDMPPGKRYISRTRSNEKSPIQKIFQNVNQRIEEGVGSQRELLQDPEWLKANVPYVGELYLGHLRYGTYGGNSIEQCHPFLRTNNWVTRNLLVAGNFNLTNVDELFGQLVDLGQHPKEKADTVTVLEKIGHFLDEQNEKLYRKLKKEGLAKKDISPRIARELDLAKILQKSAKKWDGGYAMAGLLGHGAAFVLRDPAGIRPAFFYENDEVVVVTSERPVIQTAFNVPFEAIQEVLPGHALIIDQDGGSRQEVIKKRQAPTACSFERIYFSRGSDADIYRERKDLGRRLVPAIVEAIEGDFDHTVFSFIPNTAEISFYGLMKGLEDHINGHKVRQIQALGPKADEEDLRQIINFRPRLEKVIWKDVKMRTFITEDRSRDELVSHVYDVTYQSVTAQDNLVVIDDSIVRGTTLRQSILKMLDRLHPKKIIIVSSAPQIRYPDCYGIDMARLGDFVAFKAAIALLQASGRDNVIDEVYQKCREQAHYPDQEIRNFVREIYQPFSPEEISDQIAAMITPAGIQAEVKIIYQRIEDLHEACPQHRGDWYFSGKFPTPGGNRVMNKAFLNYYEGKGERAY